MHVTDAVILNAEPGAWAFHDHAQRLSRALSLPKLRPYGRLQERPGARAFRPGDSPLLLFCVVRSMCRKFNSPQSSFPSEQP